VSYPFTTVKLPDRAVWLWRAVEGASPLQGAGDFTPKGTYETHPQPQPGFTRKERMKLTPTFTRTLTSLLAGTFRAGFDFRCPHCWAVLRAGLRDLWRGDRA